MPHCVGWRRKITCINLVAFQNFNWWKLFIRITLSFTESHVYCALQWHNPLDVSFCTVQGTPIKSNPLGKIWYLWNCSKFFRQICCVYRGGFKPCIWQISLQYCIVFKNYNSLDLNAHFSKWTGIILRNVLVILPKNEYIPNSPDLKQLDYHVCMGPMLGHYQKYTPKLHNIATSVV